MGGCLQEKLGKSKKKEEEEEVNLSCDLGQVGDKAANQALCSVLPGSEGFLSGPCAILLAGTRRWLLLVT